MIVNQNELHYKKILLLTETSAKNTILNSIFQRSHRRKSFSFQKFKMYESQTTLIKITLKQSTYK